MGFLEGYKWFLVWLACNRIVGLQRGPEFVEYCRMKELDRKEWLDGVEESRKRRMKNN